VTKTLKEVIIGRRDGKFISREKRMSALIYEIKDRGREGLVEAVGYILEELDEIRQRITKLEKAEAK